jgi:N-succinyldiaminopimelate aminotransferase
MNPGLARLRPYPFERLRALLSGARPPTELSHISMSIGEPRHVPPAFVIEALERGLAASLGGYPTTLGVPQLRASIAGWLRRRFALPAGSVDPESMILPVNGTREALFAFVQCMTDSSGEKRLGDPCPNGYGLMDSAAKATPFASGHPYVVMPNPFYQIYEGAALLAGAEPYYMGNDRSNEALPDLDSVPEDVWRRCRVLFLCSPGNPTGAVASLEYLERALRLAERHDFVVASDECYSEIYLDESHPPPGLLQAAQAAGHSAYERCIVFHSLSKRSSVPGLRSGFVAGDARLIKAFLLYRTYHGCAMPLHTQLASIPAWDDDRHVIENRALYRQKFASVLPVLREVLEVEAPDASFYLWPRVEDDERFTRELFERHNVTILPGSYIARDMTQGNPGRGRVRISLVATVPECVEAAQRIRDFVKGK